MSAGSIVSPPRSGAVDSWPPPQGSWTYADYARLPENGMRYEVLEGDLHMSPAPRLRHQDIIGELYLRIRMYLATHSIGRIWVSPLDVRFQTENLETTVQPDLVYVRAERMAIAQENYINGPPDLVIEILSPNRENYDRQKKFRIYAKAAIPEYWIVDPTACTIEINVLRGEAYAPIAVFSGREPIRSEVLPQLTLITGDVFPPA